MIPNPEHDKRRLAANVSILRLIEWMVNDHPHLRFHQALQVLGVQQREPDGSLVDHFYEEPWVTLERGLGNKEGT